MSSSLGKNRLIFGDGCESATCLLRFIMNVTSNNRPLVILPEAHISRKIHCVKNIARDMLSIPLQLMLQPSYDDEDNQAQHLETED